MSFKMIWTSTQCQKQPWYDELKVASARNEEGTDKGLEVVGGDVLEIRMQS